MLISIPQQPSRIAVYNVDTATQAETLLYDIRFYYNSKGQYDSISLAGNTYRFDFSGLPSDYRILLNYSDTLHPYAVLQLDSSQYTLVSYKEVLPSPGIGSEYTLQYTALHQLTGISYTGDPSSANYTKAYTYNLDTTFVRTQRPFDACDTRDTIYNSIYDMNTTLPWLLFTDVNALCGSIGINLLKAVPVSNYPVKLPSTIRNGLTLTTYGYTADSNYRLSVADAVQQQLSDNKVLSRWRIKFSY